MHPSRHRNATGRLLDRLPKNVAFICLGNICRSPFAAATLSQLVRDVAVVESAGFIGPGRPPPEDALAAARAFGTSRKKHRSKIVSRSLIKESEAIFIFDRNNLRRFREIDPQANARIYWLGDLDPLWSGRRTIVDPWGEGLAEFERTFARVARCVEVVADLMRAPSEGESRGPHRGQAIP